MMTSRRIASLRSALFGVAAALVVACDGNGNTSPEHAIEILRATNSGDGQAGTVGQALPAPLRILVTDDGVPSEGVPVVWSAASGGKMIASGPTGADGIAEAVWTLGPAAGMQDAQASVANATGSPLTFGATAQPGPAAHVVKLGSTRLTAQIGEVGYQLEAMVSDDFSNGLARVPVHWSVESGDATVQVASSVTDDAGISRTMLTLGTVTGPNVIVASAEGVEAPARFTVLAQLLVFVEDNYFNPAELTVTAGTTVTWYWADAFAKHNVVPDLVEPTSSGEPTMLREEWSFTFQIPGTYRYYCQVHGTPGGGGMSGTIHVTP
jgi:plastocyanin